MESTSGPKKDPAQASQGIGGVDYQSALATLATLTDNYARMGRNARKVTKISKEAATKADVAANKADAATKKADDATERLKRMSQDWEAYKSLIIVGFYVILLMVATLFVTVYLDWKNSNDRLYDSLKSSVR